MDLEAKLSDIAPGIIVIAFESVYSMDGDIAPIKDILDLATNTTPLLTRSILLVFTVRRSRGSRA